ncbi:kinase-like domain-containing protein [Hypoxylon sp. FL1150]|nr:kinase-like domain-containing protein [Hypoxylon sp. FL1150]
MASYPGLDKVRLDALKEFRLLESSIQKAKENRFKVEGILGEGTGGFALKMLMTGPPSLLPEPARRFMLKRAYNTQQEEKLQREIEFTKRFRGDAHIAQLVSFEGEPHDGVSYLKGPTLMTEWIGTLTVKDLIERRADLNIPFPNRVLWRFFLCLCRMLIAMAWPSNAPPGTPRKVELVPSPGPDGKRPPKLPLVHGDLNIQNVLVGNLDQSEHLLVHSLVLIDFGNARILPDDQGEQAVKGNMCLMGEIMLNLVGGRVMKGSTGSSNMDAVVDGERKTIRSWARDLDGLNPAYGAPANLVAEHRGRVENLDTDLRGLIIQCLAPMAANRPDLETLVEQVERNVNTKTADSYVGKKYANNETDSAIREIMHRLVHEAPTT